VALVPERRPGPVRLLWALWQIGAVAVPLSARLPRSVQQEQAARVGCRGAVRRDGADEFIVEEGREVTRASVVAESVPKGGPPAREEREATIVFTSGSTGEPKAALHTWANHLYSAKGANANLPLRRGDRWLLSLPLYHVGGLAILVRCALRGAAVVLPDPAADLATALSATRATHVSCVATQLRRLLDAREEPPPSLRAALLGGGPLPAPLLDRAAATGWPVLTSYGCTEMASQVTTTAPGASRSAHETAGARLPHRRLRIGPDGQILVAGRTLFRGYVTEDGLDDPRTDEGWYPTGDRGRLDAQGHLHVLGRIDRMFVSGGENIQPEEIETALERLPGVERAAVVPVSSAEYGRRPVAFVRTAGRLDASRLQDRLRDRLPRFKVPDAIYPFPDAALDGGLKVDRDGLQQWAMRHREGG
jgi:O-succinylbenzoic acid--CoA ligase